MVSDNGLDDCLDALTRYNVLVWVLFGMTLFMLFFRVAARRHIMAGNGKAGTRRAFASQPSTQPTGVPRACNGGAMACLCTLATCNIYGVVGERGAHAGRCAGGRGARMRRRSFSSLDPDIHSFLYLPFNLPFPPTGSTTNKPTVGSDATRPCAHRGRDYQNDWGDLSPDRLEPDELYVLTHGNVDIAHMNLERSGSGKYGDPGVAVRTHILLLPPPPSFHTRTRATPPGNGGMCTGCPLAFSPALPHTHTKQTCTAHPLAPTCCLPTHTAPL